MKSISRTSAGQPGMPSRPLTSVPRLWGGSFAGTGRNELDMRDFDPAGARRAQQQTAIAARRAHLQTEFVKWLDDTLCDRRHGEIHGARNPFTHSWLQRHVFGGTTQTMNARDLVVLSKEFAVERVAAFLEAIDHY